MSERSAIAEVEATPEPGAGAGRIPAPQPAAGGEPDQLTADLLVEEVSIDGMCGVY